MLSLVNASSSLFRSCFFRDLGKTEWNTAFSVPQLYNSCLFLPQLCVNVVVYPAQCVLILVMPVLIVWFYWRANTPSAFIFVCRDGEVWGACCMTCGAWLPSWSWGPLHVCSKPCTTSIRIWECPKLKLGKTGGNFHLLTTSVVRRGLGEIRVILSREKNQLSYLEYIRDRRTHTSCPLPRRSMCVN